LMRHYFFTKRQCLTAAGSLTLQRSAALEDWRLTPIIQRTSLLRGAGGRSTLLGNREEKDKSMATETPTETATKIKLEPPAALQPVAVHEASGLVPLKGEET